mmetsp:Transcript_140774/g.245231  ORF Transcript_140774/g.245231 Transcript_140774/m.245231 type:complete len:217 (+) Transcript_140774:701-1351(+)
MKGHHVGVLGVDHHRDLVLQQGQVLGVGPHYDPLQGYRYAIGIAHGPIHVPASPGVEFDQPRVDGAGVSRDSDLAHRVLLERHAVPGVVTKRGQRGGAVEAVFHMLEYQDNVLGVCLDLCFGEAALLQQVDPPLRQARQPNFGGGIHDRVVHVLHSLGLPDDHLRRMAGGGAAWMTLGRPEGVTEEDRQALQSACLRIDRHVHVLVDGIWGADGLL